MIKNMVCIECPKGCVMAVDIESDKVVKVHGAKCPKGAAYAVMEIHDPMRVLTATIVSEGLSLKLIPVRTNKPIPKKDILRAMDEIKKIKVKAPVKVGDIIIKNLLGLGVRVIATRAV